MVYEFQVTAGIGVQTLSVLALRVQSRWLSSWLCAGDIGRCAELVAAHTMSEEEGDAPVTQADFAKLFSALAAMETKVSN